MIQKVVCVFDRAIVSYARPFPVVHLGQALRSFTDEVNNPKSDLNAHSDDFELFHLADFDDQAGTFIPLESGPVRLARGKDVKVPPLDSSIPFDSRN